MSEKQLKRHDFSDILIHWFNAACWLVLLLTGVGLISNPDLDPFGGWYPEYLRTLVGGGGVLLSLHIIVGFVWIAGFLLYILVNPKGAFFFLKEIFRLYPVRDTVWMVKKMFIMTLGPKMFKDPTLPDQGYYNMGQKAFAQASVVGGILIAVTGVIMYLSDKMFTPEYVWIVSWSITLHYLAVGLVFAGLLVHIYMAAVSPEERPGFKSMFTGHVPADYAKHHHKLWHDKLITPEDTP